MWSVFPSDPATIRNYGYVHFHHHLPAPGAHNYTFLQSEASWGHKILWATWRGIWKWLSWSAGPKMGQAPGCSFLIYQITYPLTKQSPPVTGLLWQTVWRPVGDSEPDLVPQIAQFGIPIPSLWEYWASDFPSLYLNLLISKMGMMLCSQTTRNCHLYRSETVNGNFLWFILIVYANGVIRNSQAEKTCQVCVRVQ